MHETTKVILILVVSVVCTSQPGSLLAWGDSLHVDPTGGSDDNQGTEDKPLRTLYRAAVIVNQSGKAAPGTIRLAPGIYNLDRPVVFQNTGVYTKDNRLTISAQHQPDDPGWKPSLMPTILSTESPKISGTYSIKVNMSHVSISGLRFLGNPSLGNYHAVITRTGVGHRDLLIAQCVFIGDKNGLDINCPVIGIGDELIVDHCVFLNCHASAVFWDGFNGTVGKGNAMRYCIIYGGHIAGVWTCQTSEDFVFRNNVVANCKFAWMRKPGDRQKYTMRNCVVTNCHALSGYGRESGPFRRTGENVRFVRDNVIEDGEVSLEQNRNAQNYFQLEKGSLGSDLGAGLFAKPQ